MDLTRFTRISVIFKGYSTSLFLSQGIGIYVYFFCLIRFTNNVTFIYSKNVTNKRAKGCQYKRVITFKYVAVKR